MNAVTQVYKTEEAFSVVHGLDDVLAPMTPSLTTSCAPPWAKCVSPTAFAKAAIRLKPLFFLISTKQGENVQAYRELFEGYLIFPPSYICWTRVWRTAYDMRVKRHRGSHQEYIETVKSKVLRRTILGGTK